MSVRTSSRSNKGQNKYIEYLLQEETEAPKKKRTKRKLIQPQRRIRSLILLRSQGKILKM